MLSVALILWWQSWVGDCCDTVEWAEWKQKVALRASCLVTQGATNGVLQTKVRFASEVSACFVLALLCSVLEHESLYTYAKDFVIVYICHSACLIVVFVFCVNCVSVTLSLRVTLKAALSCIDRSDLKWVLCQFGTWMNENPRGLSDNSIISQASKLRFFETTTDRLNGSYYISSGASSW